MWGIASPSLGTPRALFLVALGLVVNSFLRGLQAPQLWPTQYFLTNYEFGFCKRCFFGTLISLLDIPYLYTYSFFFWFSLSLLLLNVLLLIGLLKRLLQATPPNADVVVLVYSSSFAIVFMASIIGFFDHAALLVALLAMWTKNFYVRALMVALLFSVSVLMHETGYLLFFPVICFRFLPDLLQEPNYRKWIVFWVVVASVTALAVLVGQARLPISALDAMRVALQAKADYPVARPDFLITTAYENFVGMRQFWQPSYVIRMVCAAIVTFPVIAFLIRQSLLRLAQNGQGPAVQIAALVASLAPLAMYLLGSDGERWNTHAITTSLIVFIIATLNFPTTAVVTQERRERGSALLIGAILIAMNLGSSIGLWSENPMDSFPYPRHIRNITDMIMGSAPFPPRHETHSP